MDRSDGASASIEDLLRLHAPQVLGALVRRFGHFDPAEDALQEALIAAAEQRPEDGVPGNPRGWLIRVASRRLTDRLRSDTARRPLSSRRHHDGWAAGAGPGSRTSARRMQRVRSGAFSVRQLGQMRGAPRGGGPSFLRWVPVAAVLRPARHRGRAPDRAAPLPGGGERLFRGVGVAVKVAVRGWVRQAVRGRALEASRARERAASRRGAEARAG